MTPRLGSELGGTAVEVRGPCFNADDTVQCSFGGVSTPGIFLDRSKALCITPMLTNTGRVAVSVEIRSTDASVTFEGNTIFFSSKMKEVYICFYIFCTTYFSHAVPIDRAHGVDVQPSILLDHNTDIRVHWDPANVFPILEIPNLFTVNVIVYQYHVTGQDGDGTWMQHTRLDDLPNNGQASVALTSFQKFSKRIAFPTCIKVAVGKPNASIPANGDPVLEKVEEAPTQPGIWSGLLFSTHAARHPSKQRNQRALRNKFSQQCTLWHDEEEQILSQEDIDPLPPCPPTLSQAQLPNSGLEEERKTSVLHSTDYHNQWMRYFHPTATKCYVQSGVRRYTTVHVLMRDKDNVII